MRIRKLIYSILAILLVAFILNLAVMRFFGEDSPYRAVHSMIGIVLLISFYVVLSAIVGVRLKTIAFFGLALVPCYLGTIFPDLDIRVLGIGGHRNPIFHSGLAYFVPAYLLRRNRSGILASIVTGFGIGLAAHLFWDIFDHADVRWIPGGVADRIWLGINGLLVLVLSAKSMIARMIPTEPKP